MGLRPNPATATARVLFARATGGTAIVYGVTGRRMASRSSIAVGVLALDVRDWPAGKYFVRWTTAAGPPAGGTLAVLR